MSLAANSYGSTADVAALVPKWANKATPPDFDTTTRPTLAQVENQVNQLSALVNALLAEAGFAIPVTQADAKLALAYFVEEEAAAIVDGINGSGRFGPSSKAMGAKGRFALLVADVQAFIEMNKAGFERLGAVRAFAATAGLAFRATDNQGNDVHPMVSREQFTHQGGVGGRPSNEFIDWDPVL
jgi:hypothetical protein